LLICGNNFIIPSNASSSRPFSAVVLNFVGSKLDKSFNKALEFVTKCNDKISQMNMDENQTLEIDALETTLPVKRQRKKKRMADELVNDERDSSDPR
jgi:hypothetical protein